MQIANRHIMQADTLFNFQLRRRAQNIVRRWGVSEESETTVNKTFKTTKRFRHHIIPQICKILSI